MASATVVAVSVLPFQATATHSPIAAGATDLIRLSLDKSDIGKPFRKTNVSVVEVR